MPLILITLIVPHHNAGTRHRHPFASNVSQMSVPQSDSGPEAHSTHTIVGNSGVSMSRSDASSRMPMIVRPRTKSKGANAHACFPPREGDARLVVVPGVSVPAGALPSATAWSSASGAPRALHQATTPTNPVHCVGEARALDSC